MSSTEQKKLSRVSVDLETLGIQDDALILSIGAVRFDPVSGTTGDPFYVVIDHGKLPLGSLDYSTVSWWMGQSAEARAAVFGEDVPRVPLAQALVAFSEYLGFNESLPDGEYPSVELWQRGTKDEAWLKSAYVGTGLALPFHFGMWQDQRTWCREFKPFLPTRVGTHHNALDDAEYQAKCVVAVYQRLYSLGVLVAGEPAPILDEVQKAFWSTLEMAYVCGLTTVAEAVDNVLLRAMSIWPYEEIQTRQEQVYKAFQHIDQAALVTDLLGTERCAKLDGELDALSDGGSGEEPDFPPAV